MILEPAKQMPLSFLKKNTKNGEFFIESNVDISSMIPDIKKRGVLIPLVAKEDGTLLAGHCRLIASKKAGLKTVPVQIIKDITEHEELEYLLKDNTIRRHFNRDERVKIYRRIYPEFDRHVFMLRKISTEKIVEISGLNYSTVCGDLHRLRAVVTDTRKKRSREQNLLCTYAQLTTRMRNAIRSGDITKEQARSVIGALIDDLRADEIIAALPKQPTLLRAVQNRETA